MRQFHALFRREPVAEPVKAVFFQMNDKQLAECD
jgi:hypothetical protein